MDYVYRRDPVTSALTAMTKKFKPVGQAAYEKAKSKPIAVATRVSAGHTGNTAAGTVVGQTFRWAHVMQTECTDLQIVLSNFYPTVTSESSNAQAITVAAGLEYNGLITRLHFNGAHLKTLDQGGIALTDPVNRSIPKGATFYTRIFVSVPVDGNVYPTSIASVTGLGDGKGTGDSTTATGALTASSGEGYAPSAIVGIPNDDDAVAFALIGDSMVGDANIDGWPIQLVQDKYGYMILSRPGSDVTTMEQNSGNAYRLRLAKYATHAIVTFGANDWNLPTAYATQEGYLKALWETLQDLGITVYQSTSTPRTTSTDAWATTANQTVYNGNTYNDKRQIFNANLRNRVYPVRMLDVAPAVEADGGVWKATLTGDGIHPVAAGKTAIVAILDLNIK